MSCLLHEITPSIRNSYRRTTRGNAMIASGSFFVPLTTTWLGFPKRDSDKYIRRNRWFRNAFLLLSDTKMTANMLGGSAWQNTTTLGRAIHEAYRSGHPTRERDRNESESGEIRPADPPAMMREHAVARTLVARCGCTHRERSHNERGKVVAIARTSRDPSTTRSLIVGIRYTQSKLDQERERERKRERVFALRGDRSIASPLN